MPSPKENGYRKNIFLLEDDKDIRELTVTLLRAEGYIVYIFKDYSHAMLGVSKIFGTNCKLRNSPFVALLDEIVPGHGTGEDVKKTIKELDATVPVISCSASHPKPRWGDHNVAKPFDNDVLLATIKRVSSDGNGYNS